MKVATFEMNWPRNKVMFMNIEKDHADKSISLDINGGVGSFYQ